ncbi:hypothetical protein ACPV5U_19335 [Vibrio mediterranei]
MACKNCEDQICCGKCDRQQYVPIPMKELQEETEQKEAKTSN